MKACPKCGNKYRPDVEVCPNDGTALGGAAPPGPPPGSGGPPGPPRPASRPAPQPSAITYEGESRSLREGSSAGSWIFALVACLLLFGGFWWARGQLQGPGEDDAATIADGSDDETKSDKKKRKRSKRKRKKSGGSAATGNEYADYDWEQDYADDNQIFGDVLSETEYVEEEVEEAPPPPPYEPTKDEWQPMGSYSPVAKYGDTSPPGVVEIDLGKTTAGSPMDEADVRAVLDVSRLMSCYHRWVQKIPGMRGRVWMTFAVAPDGRVKGVRITRSELRSRVVEECIVDAARKFRFPSAADGRTTRFDTHFSFTNR